MSVMDIFLFAVGVVTLFFSGASYALVRNGGNWKDYSMVIVQAAMGVLIITGVINRIF